VHLIRWGSETLELRYSHTLSLSLSRSLSLLAIVFTFMRLFLSFLCPCVELAIDKFFISLSDVIGRDRHVRQHSLYSYPDMNYDYFPQRFSFKFSFLVRRQSDNFSPDSTRRDTKMRSNVYTYQRLPSSLTIPRRDHLTSSESHTS